MNRVTEPHLIGASYGADGLPNYHEGQMILATYPDGETVTQFVLPVNSLPSTLQKLVRRLRGLSKSSDPRVGFREVGAFVFQFRNNRFQTLLTTLNRPDAAVDDESFRALFGKFRLKFPTTELTKVYFLHTHPDITDQRTIQFYGAMLDPAESRAVGLPWESTVILSPGDIQTARNLRQLFNAGLKVDVPFEMIAIPTVLRFSEIYFSYSP